MKTRGGLAILVCAAVTLAVPASAAAVKPGFVVKPKSLQLRLGLPASKGYSASIVTDGHRQVVLSLSKGDVFARYTALGKVSRKGIKADFGSLGQVSLRFRNVRRYHPSLIPGLKLPKLLRDRCKGRRTVAEDGIFVGNVTFEGEHGFTRIQVSRRQGRVERSYRRVCKGRVRPFAGKGHNEAVFLVAQAKRSGVTRFLITGEASLSTKDENFSLTVAFAGENKKVGRVAVEKATLVFEELDSIAISPPGKKPLTAKVKLRKPFEGTASYLEDGTAPPTWTGNLGLRLPGSGLVPLAGPEFEGELCRGTGKTFENCLDSLTESLPFRYGSGSHSQPLALARLSSLR